MLLSLAMIVRDEEAMLAGCLASVKDIVDEMIIVDTGSTDNTVAIARSYGAQVIQIAWHDDFAAARNVGLDAAKGKWILVMDADERFVGTRKALRGALAKPGVAALDVPIHNELEHREDRHSTIRVFRNLPTVRFERRLHEQVLPSLKQAMPQGRFDPAPFYLRHLGYLSSEVRRKDKRKRNMGLAKAEAEAHPDEPFSIYNLGVEYLASGEIDAAIAEFGRARALLKQPHSTHGRLYKLEAQALSRQGRLEEALDVIELFLSKWPGYTDLHFLKGLILQQRGEWQEAEKVFRHCLRLGPAPTPPYDGVDPMAGGLDAQQALGSVLALQGRYQEAMRQLRAVVTQRPGHMPSVRALVECTIAAGEDVDELMKDPPPTPAEVGAVLFRMGHYGLALRAFRQAETPEADLPVDHYLVKAHAYLRLHDARSAHGELRTAGPAIRSSDRAFVADLVYWSLGRRAESELKAIYPDDHPLWHEMRAERERDKGASVPLP